MIVFDQFSQMEQEILIKIGNKLKDLRLKKGYNSYENFAFDNDIPRVHYWRIEAGKTNITIRTLLKVLAIHNITIQDFFTDL